MAEAERERSTEGKEKKEDLRRLTVEEEMEIVRVIQKKEEKETDLIKIRTVEEMVLRQFHKYLKVFEKKELERMPMRKTWDHAIDLREGFVLKKRKIYLLSRIEKKEVQEFMKNQLRKRYIRLSKSPQMSLVFFVLKKDSKKKMV